MPIAIGTHLGHYEILAPLGAGGKWQVSTEGGSQPRWRGDGWEIFYFSPDRKLMAVEVKAEGSTFEVGVPDRYSDSAAAATTQPPATANAFSSPRRLKRRSLRRSTSF